MIPNFTNLFGLSGHLWRLCISTIDFRGNWKGSLRRNSRAAGCLLQVHRDIKGHSEHLHYNHFTETQEGIPVMSQVVV